MKKAPFLFCCGLVLFYLVMNSYHHVQGEEKDDIGYLVLGDAWASGLIGNGDVGEGYVDFISEAFRDEGYNIYVDKPYPKPFLTSSKLLTQLKGKAVQQGISVSDFITISIGLNDIQYLLTVQDSGSITVNDYVVRKSLQKVERNISQSLDLIQETQPEVEVYVMGYATPDVPSFMKDITKDLIMQLNKTLKESTEENINATFVKAPIYLPIERSSVTLLPNEIIYKQMANTFLQTYSERNGLSFQSPDSEWRWGDEASYERVITYAKSMHSSKTITREEAIHFFEYLAPRVMEPKFSFEWNDIQTSNKLYPLLVRLTDMGVIRKKDSFYPEKPITRAEMVALLARALEVPPSLSPLFSDIRSDHWANHYITGLTKIGLIKGYPDGTFKPDQRITGSELYMIWDRLDDSINNS
ncbi:hypothetical protein GLW08_03415 [Pontibacillus yanchengensis]|uniref:Uncharacterized protein n=2 Tax=Pontibacillus yanchengensis TaxID=462910 RepID=A0ACC7VC83_9BACI|nr:S-layer homology domain-containing protein [Pontibacillus yanchengensis]MYL35354.1 hypothetical protein [Pontibacillus yanchengensis]MYL52383.1 hypothetical protein [Pontibacillus yanchengensis]